MMLIGWMQIAMEHFKPQGVGARRPSDTGTGVKSLLTLGCQDADNFELVVECGRLIGEVIQLRDFDRKWRSLHG